MKLKLSYDGGAFQVSGDTILAEMAGRLDQFNYVNGVWTTRNVMSASLLREHADERAKKIFNRFFISFSPWQGALTIPKKLKLLPHQPGAVRFTLSRNTSYQALSPGLGKTPIMAVVAATYKRRCIVTCPAFLVLNVLEEFKKWAPTLETRILDNVDWFTPDVLIIADSQLTNPYVRDYIRQFKPEIVQVDEAHRFVNDNKRTGALFGFVNKRKKKYIPGIFDGELIKKRVLYSGTPILNRPIELFIPLRKCAPEYIKFMSKEQYGLKFCKAFITEDHWGNSYGYDYSGCDKEEFKKLMTKVKAKDENDSEGFMLRLNKSILGLPPLTEQIVIVGGDMPHELKSMDLALVKKYSPQDLIKFELAKTRGEMYEEDLHLMTYRKLLGIHKVKWTIEYVEDILENTNRNILLLGIHKEVMYSLFEGLKKFNPSIITGKVPVRLRQGIVNEFQKIKSKRIFLGNLDTMVGLNITKCDWVILPEFLYSPSKNLQGIDRAHRYGQKNEVHVDYLVFRNSLDANTIRTVINKMAVTSLV